MPLRGANWSRVAAAARVMIEAGSARARARLANSGVAWAPMTIAFGYDIARWLADRHPRHAEIDSFDEAGASLPALLRHALPAMEFELLAADDAASGRLPARGQRRASRHPVCSWLDRAIRRSSLHRSDFASICSTR